MGRARATRALLVLILIGFAWEIYNGVPPVGVGREDLMALIRSGSIDPFIVETGEWWRLVTAMFLHIGLLHLLFNSWALYQLGGLFELMFGARRFLTIYFVSGIVASLASVLFTRSIAAGASGAIFGILGALIVAIRRSPRWRHESWTRGLVQQLLFWAALNVFLGFTVPGIDNAAHIGGMITGMIFGLVPHGAPPPPPSGMVIEHPRE
jgi:rhomboid protease GluP